MGHALVEQAIRLGIFKHHAEYARKLREGIHMTCGSCTYFRKDTAEKPSGTCYRYPPTVIMDGDFERFIRPRVSENTPKCGEYHCGTPKTRVG